MAKQTSNAARAEGGSLIGAQILKLPCAGALPVRQHKGLHRPYASNDELLSASVCSLWRERARRSVELQRQREDLRASVESARARAEHSRAASTEASAVLEAEAVRLTRDLAAVERTLGISA